MNPLRRPSSAPARASAGAMACSAVVPPCEPLALHWAEIWYLAWIRQFPLPSVSVLAPRLPNVPLA